MSRSFLVTGASKGIGLALAQRLSRDGHRVVGLAHGPSPDFPGELVSVDLGDGEATGRVLAGLAERIPFDGVVNNVGLVHPQRLGSIELPAFNEVLRLYHHPRSGRRRLRFLK